MENIDLLLDSLSYDTLQNIHLDVEMNITNLQSYEQSKKEKLEFIRVKVYQKIKKWES